MKYAIGDTTDVKKVKFLSKCFFINKSLISLDLKRNQIKQAIEANKANILRNRLFINRSFISHDYRSAQAYMTNYRISVYLSRRAFI